jgi:hypothetical protein
MNLADSKEQSTGFLQMKCKRFIQTRVKRFLNHKALASVHGCKR